VQFSLADWRWIVDVNLFGAIHGCHTLVAWLKQNPRGAHIVNVASVAAIASAPAMAAYNVTKAGVVALSETLFAELRYDNVGVSCVCPGFFQTNLLDTGRFLTTRQRDAAADYMLRARMSADDVADCVVRAVRRKRLYVITPWRARLLWRVKRAFPLMLLKLIASLYHRQHVLEAREAGRK
jgi:short-subunit dehydrogenase